MKKFTTGITFGAFDLLHAGHVMFLETCKKKYCDYLVVGIHTDPSIERPEKHKPVQTIFERYMQLSALDVVDAVIPYDTEEDLDNILRFHRCSYRFLGSDYEGQNINSGNTCREVGTQIVFIPRKHNYSSTDIRRRIIKEFIDTQRYIEK